jgi:hypothetical protein
MSEGEILRFAQLRQAAPAAVGKAALRKRQDAAWKAALRKAALRKTPRAAAK